MTTTSACSSSLCARMKSSRFALPTSSSPSRMNRMFAGNRAFCFKCASTACWGSALTLGDARNDISSSRYRSRLTLMKSMTLSMPTVTPSGGGRGVGADDCHRKLEMKSKSAIHRMLDFERSAVSLDDLPAGREIARPCRFVAVVSRAIVDLDDEAFITVQGIAAPRGQPHRHRLAPRDRRAGCGACQQRRQHFLELAAIHVHQGETVGQRQVQADTRGVELPPHPADGPGDQPG